MSNGILIANGYCPISFHTVDSVDYKKAMLMFYIQPSAIAESAADSYTYSTTQEGIATYSSDDDADSDFTGMQLYDRNLINLNDATHLELVANVNGVLSGWKHMAVSYIAETAGREQVAPTASDSHESGASILGKWRKCSKVKEILLEFITVR